MPEPVEFTDAEREVLRSLARTMGQPAEAVELDVQEGEGYEEIARRVAREEIASLAGKALRRTQDRNYTRSPERNAAIDITNEELAEFWGEVLAEYGGES
jgi:hypothetical protein